MSTPALALASIAEVQDLLTKAADKLAALEQAGQIHPRFRLDDALTHISASRRGLSKLK